MTGNILYAHRYRTSTYRTNPPSHVCVVDILTSIIGTIETTKYCYCNERGTVTEVTREEVRGTGTGVGHRQHAEDTASRPQVHPCGRSRSCVCVSMLLVYEDSVS